MGETSRFWTGTTIGDAGPYSAAQERELWLYVAGFAGGGASRNNNAVLLGSGDGVNAPLAVLPDSPASANVRLAIGSALVLGGYYVNDTIKTPIAIAANASGNARIDTLVLRVDYVAQTIRLNVKQGTPAASPVRPALTQSAGVLWEVPLADVAVANGFTTLAAAQITNYPQYANMGAVLAHDDVLNTTGSEHKTGDVVIWDTGVAGPAAKKTTTGNDAKVAGVWLGLTANNGIGRLLYGGLAIVNVSAATAIGNQLVTSVTGGSARPVASGEHNVFAIALTSTAGAGQVLAAVSVVQLAQNFHSGVSVARSATFALSNSLQDLPWDTEVYDTDNYYAGGGSATITIPITGRYMFTGNFVVGSNNGNATDVDLSINGVVVTIYQGASGDNCALAWIASLTAGDLIKIRIKNSGATPGVAQGGLQLELLTG